MIVECILYYIFHTLSTPTVNPILSEGMLGDLQFVTLVSQC